MQFTIEAQDLVKGKSYTDGCKVFTVKRTRADGKDRTVVYTGFRKFIANNHQGFSPR